jgi:hypothetical protein
MAAPTEDDLDTMPEGELLALPGGAIQPGWLSEFFARRSGNEGYCSDNLEVYPSNRLNLFLPAPPNALNPSIVSQDIGESANIPISANTVPGGIVLSFVFPGGASVDDLAYGEVSFKWTTAGRFPSVVAPSPTGDYEETDPETCPSRLIGSRQRP